jgi:hypothetical protein
MENKKFNKQIGILLKKINNSSFLSNKSDEKIDSIVSNRQITKKTCNSCSRKSNVKKY